MASAGAKLSKDNLIACHGQCYGAEGQRGTWDPPVLVLSSDVEARPGYDSVDASEYCDTPDVLRAKVQMLAALAKQAQHCVLYSGAGLSTAAGIGDYASQPESLSGTAPAPKSALLSEVTNAGGAVPAQTAAAPRSPFCAQPTPSHRVLVAMQKAGLLQRWVNQNHDGLPQKAGLPQECINEIHGAWHAPDNPVIVMTGTLRNDLFKDLEDCARNADLCIAVGTTMCGMSADCVPIDASARAAQRLAGQLGTVIVGLQRTVHDEKATLRIFSRCDDVFTLLAEELALEVAPAMPVGEYWLPPVLVGRNHEDFLFERVPYNAMGEKKDGGAPLSWDLREDAEVVIPRGNHAGAQGVVDGFDREGNLRCIFKLKPKVGNLRAPVPLLLGRWWIQAAVDGTVPTLPVVNLPQPGSNDISANSLSRLMQEYSKPRPQNR
mmetsp:Transcript_20344/g.54366  ORF Transcript_20344/g.54366 Transcript_20344/m.54366 type:complete len:435 (-) Transcript_20344:66-1370(-)